MSDSLNNKELVAVGHQFAKAMSSDTPILDIAKIVSRLAERLDCTTAALHATQAQRDQLAAENAGLKHAMAVTLEHVSVTDTGQAGVAAMIINDALHLSETPATDAFLAEVRAQARNALIDELESRFNELSVSASTSELRSGAAGAAGFVSTLRHGAAQ
ncbi:hypothetical protein [Atlantibacter hermannii]|uniref:hypothetical protein n=1 Tax=Atlantibacter hermannii TaxID=565 RepID=UPI0019332110|nr:hypothetical protein [Atlantibacter hermannii]MBL7635133.1 hypothetical protein [Atlantibacter hermannii]MBL7675926.1 hypothetical protein [Atlantibacter hermannii]